MVWCSNKSVTTLFFILTFAASGVRSSSSGDSDVRGKSSPEALEANQVDAPTTTVSKPASCLPLNCTDPHNESIDNCPTSGTSSSDTAVKCSDLPADCLLCNFNCTCVYGEKLNVTCRPKPKVSCTPGGTGSIGHEVVKEMVCQYCYQTEEWQHFCTGYSKCNSVDTPRPLYTSNCTVGRDVVCLGRRNFLKRRECNWTSGYHWSSALFLSITLGGFGADRFYLGHWQEGIGKLFSFGGLGVWTIIDVILIAIRYLGPADGSLYV